MAGGDVEEGLFEENAFVWGRDYYFGVEVHGIVEMELFNSKSQTQIRRSQRRPKRHRLIPINMRPNLHTPNSLKILPNNAPNPRYPRSPPNNLHQPYIFLLQPSRPNNLIQVPTK